MSLPVHPLTGQRVGYCRISTESQNLDGQTDAFHTAGCEKIFFDIASGTLTEPPKLGLHQPGSTGLLRVYCGE